MRRSLWCPCVALLVVGIVAGCHAPGANGPPDVPIARALTSAQLRSLLLGPADLPTGFAPTSDALVAFGLCDHARADIETAPSRARGAFVSPGGQLLLYEQLYDFGKLAGAQRLLEDFQTLGPGCSQQVVRVVQPPGLDEDVAGYQLPRPAGATYNVGLIRSGSTVTIFMLGVNSGSVPSATWQAVGHAAELKVASEAG